VPVETPLADPAEQRPVVGAEAKDWPAEVPQEPLIAAGAVLKLAVTVQFAFTALVVNRLPLGVPPQVLDHEVL
jgi:hypothetical protein